jgi:hypothetical protein
VSKKDKYYLKKYGITEQEVQKMDEEQEYVCASCGKPYKILHLDHDHKWKYIPIEVYPNSDSSWNFVSKAFYNGIQFFSGGKTRLAARKEMKLLLQRESVRGRICWPDNRLIRLAYDDPIRLRKAAEYLERWNGKKQD